MTTREIIDEILEEQIRIAGLCPFEDIKKRLVEKELPLLKASTKDKPDEFIANILLQGSGLFSELSKVFPGCERLIELFKMLRIRLAN
jgi:hypothetical protein